MVGGGAMIPETKRRQMARELERERRVHLGVKPEGGKKAPEMGQGVLDLEAPFQSLNEKKPR